jgi:hypothetical protein
MYADVPNFTSIIGAAKLTGKTQNGLSVGFVEAVTSEGKAEIDNNGERTYETVEPLTNYAVGRVQKDFNEGKTIIGGIFTGTNRILEGNLSDYMHKNAYSGGIDFTQYFKDKKWQLTINTALSQVSGTKEAIGITQRSSAHYFQRPDKDYAIYDPDRTSLTGSGGKMFYGKHPDLRSMTLVIYSRPTGSCQSSGQVIINGNPRGYTGTSILMVTFIQFIILAE